MHSSKPSLFVREFRLVDFVDVYLDEMETVIRELSRAAVRTVVDRLELAWQRDSTVYIIGNGGSASTCSHMMNDLLKFTKLPGARPVRAVALTDNVPFLTAIANDCSYDDVFSAALENLLRPADIVIAISGSGNSPNVVRACEYALNRGAEVIGLLGSPGGRTAEIASYKVIVPAERIGQQEDGHLIINHTIAMALRERIRMATAHHAVIPSLHGEVVPGKPNVQHSLG
jgi:D-sedoheptulose 7-phosphate isomerase